MERFTERDEFGNADIIGVSSCNLGGDLSFEELNRLTRALNRLAELEDKLESGELVELPRILKWFANPKLCQVLFVEDKHICLTETMTEEQAEARLKGLQEKGQ